ncbi:MAG: MFS transporter [Firmicutes bacterium]|nr:MFS transporter [Alicyclobacillaceae bacterium]MCL6496040.1 MFS transporter [Bacillota bacterium]
MAEQSVFAREGFPSPVGPIPFLGLAVLSQTASSLVQQGVPVLGAFLQARFHLSLAGMGMTVSASTLGMMVSFAVAGSLADRLGPRRLLFWGSLGTAMAALAAAQANTLPALVVTLFLVGGTLATVPSAGMKAVFSAFAGRARGLPMGIRQTGVPVGAALAAFFLPTIVGGVGWHRLFETFAAVLLVVGVGFSRVIPPGGEAPPSGVRSRRLPWAPLVAPMVVALLMAAGQYDVLTFSIPDLVRHGGLSLAQAGTVLAAAQIGGGVARIGFGWWSDRMGGNRPRMMLVCAGLGTLGALGAAVLPGRLPVWGLGGVWFALGMGAVGWNALLATWSAERVDPSHAGFAMSATATTVFIGAALNPPLFGAVVDHWHHFYWGWLTLAAILAAAGAVLWRAGAGSTADAGAGSLGAQASS